MINAPLLGLVAVTLAPLIGMAVVLILLLWGIKEPLAWIILSFLAIVIGVGCLVYGCSQAFLLPEPRTTQAVAEVSLFIGGGAGSTVGGIVLLIVSLVRRRKTPPAAA